MVTKKTKATKTVTVQGVGRRSPVPHLWCVQTYGELGSWDNRKNAVREIRREFLSSRSRRISIVDCTITFQVPIKKGKKA